MFEAIQTRVPDTPVGTKEAERLAKELPAELIASTCPQCPLFSTKPGNEPPHMAFVLNELARLETKKAIEVQLGVLSPFQEALLVAALRAKNRSEENRRDKDKNDVPQPSLKIPAGMGTLD